jgi:hypothetical protein
MMRALDEVGKMVRHAAIGAGIPIGQADELARAAKYLVGHGQDLDCIVAALTEPPTPIDVAWGGDRMIVKTGNAVMTAPIVKDCFATGGVKARLCNPAHVPLVTAMLAEAGMQIAVDGTLITKQVFTTPEALLGPVEIPDDIWAIFTQLAARTHVPASDVSRAGGAGAGLTDND